MWIIRKKISQDIQDKILPNLSVLACLPATRTRPGHHEDAQMFQAYSRSFAVNSSFVFLRVPSWRMQMDNQNDSAGTPMQFLLEHAEEGQGGVLEQDKVGFCFPEFHPVAGTEWVFQLSIQGQMGIFCIPNGYAYL